MAVKDLMTAFDNYVAPAAGGQSSDMKGSGEVAGPLKSSSVDLGAFDKAVCPKPSPETTGGRMGTAQFANTPDHGAPNIQTSVATNLTGKVKAK